MRMEDLRAATKELKTSGHCILLGYNRNRNIMKTNTRLIMAIISNIFQFLAIILIVELLLPRWDINIPLWGLFLIVIIWLTWSVFIYHIGSRALDQAAQVGLTFPPGSIGVVVNDLAPEGTIKIQGEYWRAYSEEGATSGQEVEVITEDGMLLLVRPLKKQV